LSADDPADLRKLLNGVSDPSECAVRHQKAIVLSGSLLIILAAIYWHTAIIDG
jgi:hypothetical protein